jgi:RNA-directed DNA polymerase
MVSKVFSEPPLCFKEEVVDLLTAVCTYQGRLPMGSPASPVLSNLVCRNLDDHLIALAEAKLWTFTRFADDLTFSAKRSFAPDDVLAIQQIITEQGFVLNDAKTRVFGPDDAKIVTGILLKGRGELRPGFYEETQSELENMAVVIKAQHYHGELRTHWTEKMKQQVRGKISFIGFVLGVRNQRYMDLRDAFYTACAPPEEEFGAVSWKGFHYLN